MPSFTRDLTCPDCAREYLVCGASLDAGSQTETLAQFRCSCGQWMGAFVPASVPPDSLIVTLRQENRLSYQEIRLAPPVEEDEALKEGTSAA